MELVLATATADDTRILGEALATLLRPHDVVVLTGELGAGKTTLVQGVARGLGATEHVASPTFTLVREYMSGRLPVAHVDLYRLRRVQDVVDLGLEEVTGSDAVLLVEWGDPIEELLGEESLRIVLTTPDPAGGPDERRIQVQPRGSSWEERADALEAATGRWST